jgi:tRNA 2-thiouridine synthesizing protein B
MILHTVNKASTNSSALAQCLSVIGNNDYLLLIEDGVYNALLDVAQLTRLNGRCNVLMIDADARGISAKAATNFNLVSYEQFVGLVVNCKSIQSWF